VLKLALFVAMCCMPLVGAPSKAAIPAPPLYARMGGTAVVTAVVADMVDHASLDPQLKATFEGVNLARVKGHIVELLCERGGGGCTYSGDSMRDVHGGLGINEAQFFHLVEILRDSMRRHGVRLRERNEIVQILAPMKRDIVER
jgi:hemoglobin